MARGGYKAFRQRGVQGLAWASFAIAVAGGALVVDTWIGQLIRNILSIFDFWPWLVPVLLLAAVVAVVLDMFLDAEPNQVAIYGALTIPTIAASTSGKLGETVTEWSRALLGWMSGPLQEWTGAGSATGLALACVVASLLMAQRVVKKGRKTGAAA